MSISMATATLSMQRRACNNLRFRQLEGYTLLSYHLCNAVNGGSLRIYHPFEWVQRFRSLGFDFAKSRRLLACV